MLSILNWIKTANLFSPSQLDDAAFKEFRSSFYEDTTQPKIQLNTIITYLCQNVPSITQKLYGFEKKVLSICQESSKATWYLQQIIDSFERIAFHHTLCMKNTPDKQPLLALEEKLKDLDLNQCLEGSIERLHALNVSLYTPSFHSKIGKIKYEFIHNQIAYFIAPVLNRSKLSADIGMEIHFVSALMKAIAEEYHLPRINNVYIEDICKRNNWSIIQMACAHSVRETWEKYFFNHLQGKLAEDLFSTINTVDNPPSIKAYFTMESLRDFLTSIKTIKPPTLEAKFITSEDECKTSCLYLTPKHREEGSVIIAARKISEQDSTLTTKAISFSEIDHYTPITIQLHNINESPPPFPEIGQDSSDTIQLHAVGESPLASEHNQAYLKSTRLGNEFQHICLLNTLLQYPEYITLLPVIADNFTLPLWSWIEELPEAKAYALKSFISHHPAQPPVGLYAREGIEHAIHFPILYLITHHMPEKDLRLDPTLNAFKKASGRLIELSQKSAIDKGVEAVLLSTDVQNILEKYQLHSWLMSKYIEWELSPKDTFQLIIKSIEHSQEGISVYQPIIHAHLEIIQKDLEAMPPFSASMRPKLLASYPNQDDACSIRLLLQALCDKAKKQNSQTFVPIFAQYIIENDCDILHTDLLTNIITHLFGIKTRTDLECSVLRAAVLTDCPELITNLLDSTSHPNIKTLKGHLVGLTIQHQCYKALKHLLLCEADPNQPDKEGNPPLLRALNTSNTTLMTLLLQAKIPCKITFKMLRVAATQSDSTTLRLLLSAGADPNMQDADENSVIQYALIEGHYANAHILFEHNATLSPLFSGRNLLNMAIEKNNLTLARFLLSNGISPNIHEHVSFSTLNSPISPLEIAVFNNNIRIVTLLLHYKAPTNVPRLFQLAVSADLEIMHQLLHTEPAQKMIRQALHQAVKLQKIECIQALTQHKPSSNCTLLPETLPLAVEKIENLQVVQLLLQFKHSEASIQMAFVHAFRRYNRPYASNSMAPIIQALLQCGAKPEKPMNVKKETALHFAARDNTDSMLKLIASKANINTLTICGKSPLFYALSSSKEDTTKYLLRLEADLALTDSYYQQTPLHIALLTYKTNFNIVQCLLKYKANPNAQDTEGDTPLHLSPNYEYTELLLFHNANPNIKNNHAQLALHRAVSEYKQSPKEIQLLLQHGADPSIEDNDSDSALTMCITQLLYHSTHPSEDSSILKACLTYHLKVKPKDWWRKKEFKRLTQSTLPCANYLKTHNRFFHILDKHIRNIRLRLWFKTLWHHILSFLHLRTQTSAARTNEIQQLTDKIALLNDRMFLSTYLNTLFLEQETHPKTFTVQTISESVDQAVQEADCKSKTSFPPSINPQDLSMAQAQAGHVNQGLDTKIEVKAEALFPTTPTHRHMSCVQRTRPSTYSFFAPLPACVKKVLTGIF